MVKEPLFSDEFVADRCRR